MYPKQITATVSVAVVAALSLGVVVLSGACVEKVSPCEEFDKFAEIYGPSCPEVNAWATECASNIDTMNASGLEIRQDFDWCVDCYRAQHDNENRDCSEAPLGALCPTLLNDTLDASCIWPNPTP